MKSACVVNFHNVITVPRDGLGARVTQLRAARWREVCEALAFALGCDA
jgi:mRNA-degrading endonuclease toxin of MazEF toxin-antitoxin module